MADPDFPTPFDALDADVVALDPAMPLTQASLLALVLATVFLIASWFVYHSRQKDNAN